MDRLKGLGSFALITTVVLLGLRLLHVFIPVMLPQTRQGPIAITSLDEVRPRVGFAPLMPAYRPLTLGDRPASMTVVFNPRPTFVVVWQQGEQYLSITERQGGPQPGHSPLSQPLTDVADSTWWMEGSRSHLILARGDYWIDVETSLPPGELKRFADTLTRY
jgi:hypothetical protein